MRRRLALIGLTATLVAAQSFEVASVKLSDPTQTGSRVGIAPGGVFQARNVTLKSLIQQAFDVRDFQISGGPGWMSTEKYDIEGKGNGPAVSESDLVKMTDEQRHRFQEQMLARLRALLAGRFQLKVHTETREMPVYALIVTKNGPKIVKTAEDFTQESSLSVRRGPDGKTELSGKQAPLASLARQLSNQTGRPVIDKTGLKGNFDFQNDVRRGFGG